MSHNHRDPQSELPRHRLGRQTHNTSSSANEIMYGLPEPLHESSTNNSRGDGGRNARVSKRGGMTPPVRKASQSPPPSSTPHGNSTADSHWSYPSQRRCTKCGSMVQCDCRVTIDPKERRMRMNSVMTPYQLKKQQELLHGAVIQEREDRDQIKQQFMEKREKLFLRHTDVLDRLYLNEEESYAREDIHQHRMRHWSRTEARFFYCQNLVHCAEEESFLRKELVSREALRLQRISTTYMQRYSILCVQREEQSKRMHLQTEQSRRWMEFMEFVSACREQMSAIQRDRCLLHKNEFDYRDSLRLTEIKLWERLVSFFASGIARVEENAKERNEFITIEEYKRSELKKYQVVCREEVRNMLQASNDEIDRIECEFKPCFEETMRDEVEHRRKVVAAEEKYFHHGILAEAIKSEQFCIQIQNEKLEQREALQEKAITHLGELFEYYHAGVRNWISEERKDRVRLENLLRQFADARHSMEGIALDQKKKTIRLEKEARIRMLDDMYERGIQVEEWVDYKYQKRCDVYSSCVQGKQVMARMELEDRHDLYNLMKEKEEEVFVWMETKSSERNVTVVEEGDHRRHLQSTEEQHRNQIKSAFDDEMDIIGTHQRKLISERRSLSVRAMQTIQNDVIQMEAIAYDQLAEDFFQSFQLAYLEQCTTERAAMKWTEESSRSSLLFLEVRGRESILKEMDLYATQIRNRVEEHFVMALKCFEVKAMNYIDNILLEESNCFTDLSEEMVRESDQCKTEEKARIRQELLDRLVSMEEDPRHPEVEDELVSLTIGQPQCGGYGGGRVSGAFDSHGRLSVASIRRSIQMGGPEMRFSCGHEDNVYQSVVSNALGGRDVSHVSGACLRAMANVIDGVNGRQKEREELLRQLSDKRNAMKKRLKREGDMLSNSKDRLEFYRSKILKDQEEHKKKMQDAKTLRQQEEQKVKMAKEKRARCRAEAVEMKEEVELMKEKIHEQLRKK